MGSDRSMVWRLKRPRCEGHRVWAESQGKLNRNAISASAAGDKTSTRLCIWTEESWCAMGAAVQVVHLHCTTWFTHPCRSIIHLCDWNDCGFFCLLVFLWNEHVAWMELGWNSKLGKAYKCSLTPCSCSILFKAACGFLRCVYDYSVCYLRFYIMNVCLAFILVIT